MSSQSYPPYSIFVPVPSVSVTICLTVRSSNISTRPEGQRTSISTDESRLPRPKVSQGLLVERPEPALTSWMYMSSPGLDPHQRPDAVTVTLDPNRPHGDPSVVATPVVEQHRRATLTSSFARHDDRPQCFKSSKPSLS